MAKPIILRLASLFDDKGLNKATQRLQGLGGELNKISSTAIKAGASFAAFQGGRALFDVGQKSIESARDLERNLAALDTVFGSVAPRIQDFTKSSVDFGLSQSEAAQASVFLGSVIKQSGFAIEETAGITEDLVGLGADLALTYGYDVQEALLGMTALFRGEYDPIEKFGVAMKQSEINAELMARGLNGLEGAERRLAEQQIRLELLFERSADAQGAFSRQSGTLAVEQEKLEATLNNTFQTVGTSLLPAMSDLAKALQPLAEQLAPQLEYIFRQIIPSVEAFSSNTEQAKQVVDGLATTVGNIIKVLGGVTSFLLTNSEAIFRLVTTLGTAVIVYKAMTTGVIALAAAQKALNGAIAGTTVGLKALKTALARTGIGLLAVGIGELVYNLGFAQDSISDTSDELPEFNYRLGQTAEAAAAAAANLQLFTNKRMSLRALEGGEAQETQDPLEGVDFGVGTGTITETRDYVKEFYDNLADEAQKQKSRLRLENLEASEGLINAILGSGEQWEEVFDKVIENGKKSVAEAQALFNQTADGLSEIATAVEAENARLQEIYRKEKEIYDAAVDEFNNFRDAALKARDGFRQFLDELEVLPTFEQEIGRFERAIISDLENIEQKLQQAFDNGQLLEDSFRDLQSYARSESEALRGIARQRDQLLERRNLAAALIEDVKSATLAAGDLTSIIRDTQEATERIDMTKVVQDTVQAGKNLRDFRVTIISDFVKPVEEAKSKADELVDGFQNVVARTKTFVQNIKALRELGLDPTLFNQLVQSGVEAGGETAQALVDGGADTINEINSLFAELDTLGSQLGEETAQVMYGEGQHFVDGIVNGLDSMLEDLEMTATTLADAFTDAFAKGLEDGIAKAIEAARRAIPPAPVAPTPIIPPDIELPPDLEGELEEVVDGLEGAGETIKDVFGGVGEATSPATGGKPGSVINRGINALEEAAKEARIAADTEIRGIANNALAREKAGLVISGTAGMYGSPTLVPGANFRPAQNVNITVNATAQSQGSDIARALTNYVGGRDPAAVRRLLN